MYNAKFRAISQLLALMLAFVSLPRASAGFSSIYVFGDGVCTTTDNSTTTGYYDQSYCNGKVWVESVSKWQGVTYSAAKNLSYYGHNSIDLKANATAFVAPADVSTSLFFIWCNNADFVDFVGDLDTFGPVAPWTASMTQSIVDHSAAITTLYDKEVRLIVAPNAVDVMEIPNFVASDPSDRTYVRNRVIEYNVMFKSAMSNLMASKPGLKILYADAFGFFDQVISDPASYGLVNPVPNNAGLIDSGDSALNGPGASYVFWDQFHPTAKFQMHLADFFQKIVSPVKVNSIACVGGNVQLQIANVPLGRAGSIQGGSNLQPPWSTELSIDEPFVSGGTTTKDYSFPTSGSKRFYRVGFPVVWTWP